MTALSELIAEHDAALAAYDAVPDEDWGKDDPTGRRVDAAIDALLDHRPATLDEASAKATFMLSARTFREWDSIEQVRLIEALNPTLPTAEHPAVKVRRLGREMSAALAEYADAPAMICVRPAGSAETAIWHVECDDYARIMSEVTVAYQRRQA